MIGTDRVNPNISGPNAQYLRSAQYSMHPNQIQHLGGVQHSSRIPVRIAIPARPPDVWYCTPDHVSRGT